MPDSVKAEMHRRMAEPGSANEKAPATAMRPPAFARMGRSFRGNLHTHSHRSDGMAAPEQVIAEYRAAGYDFLVLTDHFEARWDWTVTGHPAAARDESFTTLLGAELISTDWDHEEVFWVNAIGLPADFPGPAPGNLTRH